MQGGMGGEEQMGKGKKRGRDGRRNGKTIRVLRRCEKLAVFSESESLFVKIRNGKKILPLGQFMRILGYFIECSFFFFSDRLPLLS